jgi:hypothetical protein
MAVTSLESEPRGPDFDSSVQGCRHDYRRGFVIVHTRARGTSIIVQRPSYFTAL